jgi:hypothetical protein
MDHANVVKDKEGAPLVCYGCGHSAGGVAYPSGPSGERPCAFCIRNPKQAEQLAAVLKHINPGVPYTARYDNGPCRKSPADQYIATDRISRELPDGTSIIT